jgi:hypothetical protein
MPASIVSALTRLTRWLKGRNGKAQGETSVEAEMADEARKGMRVKLP